MILFRLALKKFISYMRWDKPSQEDEIRQKLLHKKEKKITKTQLKLNASINLYISLLLSLMGILLSLSLPYAVLDSPCEVLLENQWNRTYVVAKWLGNYTEEIDQLMLLCSILLVFFVCVIIIDGIRNTDISKSPWEERKKYVLPKHMRSKRQKKYGTKKPFQYVT